MYGRRSGVQQGRNKKQAGDHEETLTAQQQKEEAKNRKKKDITSTDTRIPKITKDKEATAGDLQRLQRKRTVRRKTEICK